MTLQQSVDSRATIQEEIAQLRQQNEELRSMVVSLLSYAETERSRALRVREGVLQFLRAWEDGHKLPRAIASQRDNITSYGGSAPLNSEAKNEAIRKGGNRER